MFYRARFDSRVGGLLRSAGFKTTQDQINFWPIGETAKAIRVCEQLGLSATEGAIFAIRSVVQLKRNNGEINEDQYQYIWGTVLRFIEQDLKRTRALELGLAHPITTAEINDMYADNFRKHTYASSVQARYEEMRYGSVISTESNDEIKESVPELQRDVESNVRSDLDIEARITDTQETENVISEEERAAAFEEEWAAAKEAERVIVSEYEQTLKYGGEKNVKPKTPLRQIELDLMRAYVNHFFLPFDVDIGQFQITTDDEWMNWGESLKFTPVEIACNKIVQTLSEASKTGGIELYVWRELVHLLVIFGQSHEVNDYTGNEIWDLSCSDDYMVRSDVVKTKASDMQQIDKEVALEADKIAALEAEWVAAKEVEKVTK